MSPVHVLLVQSSPCFTICRKEYPWQLHEKYFKSSRPVQRVHKPQHIRATAVTVLDHSNFEARHIMRVSGHKSEARIRSYSRRLSENKQREISETLGQACGFPSEIEETTLYSLSETRLELTSSQYEKALDTIYLSPLPCHSLPGSPVLHATQTNTLKNVTFASGAFNNCNATFNFNSK